jgi:hypothetical protein
MINSSKNATHPGKNLASILLNESAINHQSTQKQSGYGSGLLVESRKEVRMSSNLLRLIQCPKQKVVPLKAWISDNAKKL